MSDAVMLRPIWQWLFELSKRRSLARAVEALRSLFREMFVALFIAHIQMQVVAFRVLLLSDATGYKSANTISQHRSVRQ